jgi:hypothetical protein
LSFDRFFSTEIYMGTIPPMMNELVDDVTITLLQMRCA